MLCHFTLLVGDICIVSNDIGSSVVFIISKVIVANNVDLDIQHHLVSDRRNIGKRSIISFVKHLYKHALIEAMG